MATYHLTVDVDHHRFFVEEPDAEYVDWNIEAAYEMAWRSFIGLMPHGFTVPTLLQFGDVNVTVDIVDDRPRVDFHGWDYAVECGIKIETGELAFFGPECGCQPGSPRVPVQPGTYRVLVLAGGTDSDPESVAHGKQQACYRLVFWPGEVGDPVVLKRGAWWEAIARQAGR